MFNKKEILKRNLATKREFNYSKGNCNLGFTLDIDAKKDLQNFRELLEQAKKDVDETISKL